LKCFSGLVQQSLPAQATKVCRLAGSKAVVRFSNGHLKTWKILFSDLTLIVKEGAADCFDWHQ